MHAGSIESESLPYDDVVHDGEFGNTNVLNMGKRDMDSPAARDCTPAPTPCHGSQYIDEDGDFFNTQDDDDFALALLKSIDEMTVVPSTLSSPSKRASADSLGVQHLTDEHDAAPEVTL